ncbi:MAG: OmpA family protein [Bacteroidaceae bacterium]|nr:OmpA family protein [Bacteroidaceae bacterium]
MLNLKTTIAASIVALCSANAMAQSKAEVQEQELGYKPQPYTFIQVQGGVGTVFTDVKMTETVLPTFGLGVGRMFSPSVGARLHFNGYRSRGAFDYKNIIYKYGHNYITTDADIMINVMNLFQDKNFSRFNLYLVGGVGLSYTWNNSEFESLNAISKAANYDVSNAWGDKQSPRHSLISHNLRAGLLADYNVSKHFSIGLEVDMNSLDDRFNSKYNNSDDWMMTAMLTATYKFGFKKASKPAPKPVPVVEPVPEPEPEPEYATRIDTIWYDSIYYEENTRDRAIKKEIFFGLRESGVETSNAQINDVAKFLKGVKNAEITITSYADKGTGTPEKNMGYSKTRAEKTKKALIAAGVDPKIIKKVEWKGDTEQPYAENDKNRLSVITGHGIYTDKDQKTVKKFRTKEVTYRVK